MNVLLFLLILIFEFIALYMVKYTAQDNNKLWLFIAVYCYAMIPLLLYFIIKDGKDGIAMTNILWNIASTVYGLIIGIYIFSEKVNNLQIIGGLLGMLGIILIGIGNNK